MRARTLVRNLGRLLFWGLLGFLLATLLIVGSLRWVDPPTSSFMVQHWVSALIKGRHTPYLYHEWTDWDLISPAARLAVVAAEDQRFPVHKGFDLVEIEKAWRGFRKGERLRGASTISQQVAKNLFLWPEKSLVRKGLEAWLTLAVELTWPKRRILEVYLNIAQFSANTYGIGAASWRYFDRPAVALTAREAALLAAVLPNPDRYRIDAPSRFVLKRARWVSAQMRKLGTNYLRGL